MKKLGLLLVLLIIVLGLAACKSNDSALQEIRNRGKLRVGVKVDVPNFGYLNPQTNKLEGMEIDLARLLAQDLLGNSEAVDMIGVTTLTRETTLDNGAVDVIIATFTITEERKKQFHFTEPYYTDSIGFLARKGSDLSRMQDIDGKTIGVMRLSTAESALIEAAQTMGLNIQFERYSNYPEVMAALLSGKVDVFSVDRSILFGYVNEDTVILDESFNPQSYGIAAKQNHTALANHLDEWMATMKKDGRLSEILARWNLDEPES